MAWGNTSEICMSSLQTISFSYGRWPAELLAALVTSWVCYAGCKAHEITELFQDHTGRRCWWAKIKVACDWRWPAAQAAIRHCWWQAASPYPGEPALAYQWSFGSGLPFFLSRPNSSRERMGGHRASRCLGQHTLAEETELLQPGSLLPGYAPNKTSIPTQQ